MQILVLREIFFLCEAFMTNMASKILNFSMIRIDMSLDTVAVGVVLVAAWLRALVDFLCVSLCRRILTHLVLLIWFRGNH